MELHRRGGQALLQLLDEGGNMDRLERAEGVPTLLIRNGELIEEALRIERLNLEDLRTAARLEGIRDLEDVEWAVLEQDGKFSFFAREQSG